MKRRSLFATVAGFFGLKAAASAQLVDPEDADRGYLEIFDHTGKCVVRHKLPTLRQLREAHEQGKCGMWCWHCQEAAEKWHAEKNKWRVASGFDPEL